MRRVIFTTRYEKDVARVKKRGANIEKLREVMLMLAKNEPLHGKHNDHPLRGKYVGFRECHIAPDWLLIYRLVGEDELELARTGTHADLFKE